MTGFAWCFGAWDVSKGIVQLIKDAICETTTQQFTTLSESFHQDSNHERRMKEEVGAELTTTATTALLRTRTKRKSPVKAVTQRLGYNSCHQINPKVGRGGETSPL